MKKLVLSSLFIMQVFFGFAQKSSGIGGKVVDSKTQKPLQGVVVSIQNAYLTQLTDTDGKFVFKNIPVGNQLLQIRNQGYKEQLLQIEIESGKMLDLGIVVLEEDIVTDEKNSIVTLNDNDLSDDNSGSESTSSLLQSSRDAFNQAAAFNWGGTRFKVRGLDNAYSTVMINGITMNKIYDGRPQYGNWGGLNDATRNQEYTNGSVPSDYTFGGILGTEQINTRASVYKKGIRVSVAGSNTNYNGRLMGTISSGVDKNGWSYVVSASRRFGNQGYFEGTNYDANSFSASVEKKINSSHSINFTTIYGQNKRGKTSANTQEVTDLKGFRYNAYWGYQNGVKRIGAIKSIEEPIFILSDYWKISPKTNLNTNVSYQFGKVGNNKLAYQGADNPDPSYYKNLPSYETSLYDSAGNFTPNYVEGAQKRDLFIAGGQLDWDHLIYQNKNSGDGHSYYALYEERTDDKQFTANTILSSQLADNINFNAGVTYRNLKSHNFQNMLDLLGGDYFRDITLYGVGSNQQQQNLNTPVRTVGLGDTFGYNYNLMSNNIDAFTQFKFTFKKVDFYLSQSFSRSEYQREGLYKNGYYPGNSFGKSDKLSFDNFGFKGGLTYKISGRQYFTVNGAYLTKAPSLKNTFNNARVNNNIVGGVGSETISSADVSYIISNPKLKTRLTAYYSKIKNQTETAFFFGDGAAEVENTTGGTTPVGNAFVNQTVTNISKRNIGLEFGVEYPITSTLKVTASAAYGEYIYDNNPTVLIGVDANATSTNSNPVLNYGEANLKNYKQSGMPQTAASFGIEYRDPKFWFIGANINYLGNNYISVAPITRTARFYDDVTLAPGVPVTGETLERATTLLKQEKFKDFNLLNLTGGKSWRVYHNTVGFFASIDNVLDVKYKTGGFEQARNSNFTQLNQDVSSGTPAFGSKYFYGYGRTYLLNFYINF